MGDSQEGAQGALVVWGPSAQTSGLHLRRGVHKAQASAGCLGWRGKCANRHATLMGSPFLSSRKNVQGILTCSLHLPPSPKNQTISVNPQPLLPPPGW